MALSFKFNNEIIGVGDSVRVTQIIKEAEKSRLQAFEGIIIKIKGEKDNRTFTVRRIGANQIGIERIFSLTSPVIESIEVVKKGVKGVRRAKLYFLRDKSKKDIEIIYKRVKKKDTISKKVTKKAKSKY